MIRNPEFTVGDRVVIIDKYDNFLGETGTIFEIDHDKPYPYAVRMDTGEGPVWCFASEIHPVDDDPYED